LGVVGVDGVEFVVADIPGLIAGAHEGVGLGVRFLGHVERCAVLLHLVDGTSETPVEDYHTIIGELEAYGGDLAHKPRVTVLNKVDAIEAEEIGAIEAALAEASGGPVMRMSGVAQVGTVEVLRALRTQIDEGRLREKAGEDEEEAWRP
jgi:GTP-binding protein